MKGRALQYVLPVTLACTLLMRLGEVRAQVDLDPGTGNNLDVEHLEVRPLGFPTVGRAENQRWGEWAVGAWVHYARNPLVLRQGRLQVGEVVRNRLSLDLVGNLGLTERLEAQAVLPITVWQDGDSGLPTGELAVAGLRDMRLALKYTVLSQRDGHPLGLGLRPEVVLPTGDAGAFLGAGSVRFLPAVVVDRSFSMLEGVHFAGSIGLNLRPDVDVGNVSVRDEIVVRLAAGLGLPPLGDLSTMAFVELGMTSRLDAPFADPETSPLVGRMGLRAHFDVAPGHGVHSAGGFGAGTTRGYGAPDAQVYAGAVYVRSRSDRDGDGYDDHEDDCPDAPEDFDGFEDEDGCPDPDNDQDGIPDVEDACPDVPEDFDGFEDDDGCPDPDNDQDGIPDLEDACPDVAEDFDGFDDDDGCPEEDSDQDGIVDEEDECPDEKETINGFEDEDGCPDDGEPQVEVTTEKVTIDSRIEFAFDSAEIRPQSFSILNQVALTLKANPQLARVRVEGHTDDQGPQAYNQSLSQARAESVLAYLVSKGLSRARLQAQGFGESRPLVEGTGEEVWAKNRRVEFTILDRAE